MEFELPVPGTLGSNEITKEKQRVSEALARVEAQRETVAPALLGHSSTATFLPDSIHSGVSGPIFALTNTLNSSSSSDFLRPAPQLLRREAGAFRQ
jgi:hypothetical protein